MEILEFLKPFFTWQALLNALLAFFTTIIALANDTIKKWLLDKLDDKSDKRKERKELAKEVIRIVAEAEFKEFTSMPDRKHLNWLVKQLKLENEELGKEVEKFFTD